ncbi:hypothetical protein [Nonomuraea typhae]|uniref:Uncharacterized protein n=1 Tax=Nonomuraea typhae TaxID=2603600 RepID=A0ABW7YZE4_9ACTN
MLQEFLDWAYARHTNTLSWYIRPLFVLPLAYFAWRRSWKGITLTIVALFSSMFWFPPPARVDPQVQAFLDMEKELIRSIGDLSAAHVLGVLAVIGSLTALCLAFWHRSLGWGLVIINLMALLKVVWSVNEGGDSGWAVLLPAVLGLALCDAVIVWIARRFRLPIALRQPRP